MIETKHAELKDENRRHYFFLNPYNDAAFTKCPKCESKTVVRKFPLAIHIEPGQLLVLNKTCRYCTSCDLIIARKSQVEALMTACFEDKDPEIITNEYVVMGTLEKRDWRARNRMGKNPEETIKRTHVFKDVWDFELMPRWYLAKE
jgi:predicted RNA-binding Zn-ribbon protein involved in translation (DUF1610 family)